MGTVLTSSTVSLGVGDRVAIVPSEGAFQACFVIGAAAALLGVAIAATIPRSRRGSDVPAPLTPRAQVRASA